VSARRQLPAKLASGRLRKAAEHYVRNGCKSIGPSLIHAGYTAFTASQPTKNGYSHDRLVEIASCHSKGGVETAKRMMPRAIAALGDLLQDDAVSDQVRAMTAKVLLDFGLKEQETENVAEIATDEQAKWMAQIRYWKRTFLRRGIMLGRHLGRSDFQDGEWNHFQIRAERLLSELDWALGKGPKPAWMVIDEHETDGVQRPEGDLRQAPYIDAEVVENEEDGGPG